MNATASRYPEMQNNAIKRKGQNMNWNGEVRMPGACSGDTTKLPNLGCMFFAALNILTEDQLDKVVRFAQSS